jgi:hypothetical protein
MCPLTVGSTLYYTDFDPNLDWYIVPISPERRFPFRFRTNLLERQFEITFKINPLKVIYHDPDAIETLKLMIKIVDSDDDDTVLFNDTVVEQQQFKVKDLFVYFSTITLFEENMLQEGDFGTKIDMGVALESTS